MRIYCVGSLSGKYITFCACTWFLSYLGLYVKRNLRPESNCLTTLRIPFANSWLRHCCKPKYLYLTYVAYKNAFNIITSNRRFTLPMFSLCLPYSIEFPKWIRAVLIKKLVNICIVKCAIYTHVDIVSTLNPKYRHNTSVVWRRGVYNHHVKCMGGEPPPPSF